MQRCHGRLTSLLFVSFAFTCSVQAAHASEANLSTRDVYASLEAGSNGSFDFLDPQFAKSRIHLPASITKATGQGARRAGYGAARRIMLEGRTEAERLKSLIAGAEVGSLGYEAIHTGAKRRPALRPTQMTLSQVLHWIAATPGQPHAIGRYQFIPTTLRELINRTGLPLSTQFDAHTQDKLADVLLHDAGFNEFQRGDLGRTRFMNNLARIWAGLPTSTGRSAYHGYAGNYATISWSDYDRHMVTIFN
ncbi:hypothetical protein K3757_11015 [Sulfitobacter sp. S223]|uniref:hypothetical protein n=1 Tax=Sulfitobacter sp. S223 TaxID=2867023 RepID=UPI0021A43E57|nr:hypothetical protein [Sulfitobacter sp. S223]UWR25011.1 hypothetical protein K3757_11015 [Sulfitobacter sp. S223]